MPRVTMRPARAPATALARVSCSASTSAMAESAAIIQITACGSVCATSSAAAAAAGAELRPTGSSTMRASGTPASRNCSATRKRCSLLQTITGAAKPGPRPRRAVSTIIEVSCFSRPQNCLGKLSRDTGHNRVPDPPERMTGTISVSRPDEISWRVCSNPEILFIQPSRPLQCSTLFRAMLRIVCGRLAPCRNVNARFWGCLNKGYVSMRTRSAINATVWRCGT